MNEASPPKEFTDFFELWKATPMAVIPYSHTSFISWQGAMFTKLRFNTDLQARFRKASNDIISAGEDFSPTYDCNVVVDGKTAQQLVDCVSSLMHEAMNELLNPVPPPAPILSSDHHLGWYLLHCGWGSRLAILGGVCTVFAAGFWAGNNDWIRTRYREITETDKVEVNQTPAQNTTPTPTTPDTSKEASTAPRPATSSTEGASTQEATSND